MDKLYKFTFIKKRNLTASFYFQANTLQTKQKVKDYNTSLICIYHILICEASISNITPSDHEVCDGKHTSTTNQIFCHQSQINATHNNSLKTRQKHRILYQLMQKKFPSSTKKAAMPTDHCWGYICLRGFSMQYIP